jgi:hypothetical protein
MNLDKIASRITSILAVGLICFCIFGFTQLLHIGFYQTMAFLYVGSLIERFYKSVRDKNQS